MLATGRYAQWQSRFTRYINTRPNSKELRQCIYEGPYVMTEILVPEKPATTIRRETEAIIWILLELRGHLFHYYSCTTAKEMWIAIERLQQGKSLNKQDVKTNLFCEIDDTDEEPNEQELEAHYLYMAKIQEEHTDQPKNLNDTPLMETVDSNTTLDSLDVCDNDFKDAQNANDQEDERCKSALAESNDIRDRCRSTLHNQEIELEKYKKYKDCQIEKEELEQKHAELVHQSSLEHIRYDRLRKEMEQLQKDFKIREDKDINKVIALENQIKFLNKRVYKTNQSVQTIHMLAHNPSSSYNGRPSFSNPKYLKKAQSEKPCLYKVPFDKDDLANIFAPDSADSHS
ncbi:hypothetical protein Tco_0658483 [Tanacetum coccineum]